MRYGGLTNQNRLCYYENDVDNPCHRNESGVSLFSTYGTDEIGDVPNADIVINTILW